MPVLTHLVWRWGPQKVVLLFLPLRRISLGRSRPSVKFSYLSLSFFYFLFACVDSLPYSLFFCGVVSLCLSCILSTLSLPFPLFLRLSSSTSPEARTDRACSGLFHKLQVRSPTASIWCAYCSLFSEAIQTHGSATLRENSSHPK